MNREFTRQKKLAAGILIVLTACNLRAPITSVGSLIHMISDDLSLSPGLAGSLTTIPLLAFAAVSPAAAYVGRRMGAGNLLLVSLLLVNLGILLRSFGGETGLFAGTLVIGLGLGVGNVLLPAVVKTYFPDRIESMTSLYTVVMQMTSACCIAISVPVAEAAGWRQALAVLVPMTFCALLFCLPNRRMKFSQGAPDEKGKASRVYRSPLSWWIALYMGSQSMVFYCFIAWLSPILQDRGYDEAFSGYVLSAYVVMGFLGSAALPWMMKRNKTQTGTGIQLGVLYSAGMLAMMAGASFAVLLPAILLCGFCSGAFISFVMALFGLHTANGEDASRLSGLAQSAGYLIAAVGPALLGKVYDIADSWTLPLGILTAITLLLIFMGKIVGRDEIL